MVESGDVFIINSVEDWVTVSEKVEEMVGKSDVNVQSVLDGTVSEVVV